MVQNPANTLKKMLFKALCFILLTVTAPVATASHIVGGEITYSWLQANSYMVKLTIYQDCSGLPAASSVSLNYSGCGMVGSFQAYLQGSPVMITDFCSTAVAGATCNGGTLFSVQKVEYQGVMSLPGQCASWLISYTECCRNGSVTNLVQPATQNSYFSATLNNFNFPYNNSIAFCTPGTTVIPSGSTSMLSWTGFDADGDSLIYELASARSGFSSPCSYNAPLSYLNPLNASQPTQLNAANGMLTLTPSGVQIAVVCMKVSEYKNGILAGTVYREMQFNVTPSSNSLPVMSGINGTGSFSTSVCAGDTLGFWLSSSDPDSSQASTIELAASGTTASLTGSFFPPITSNFSWITDSSNIAPHPYYFVFKVKDSGCNYSGVQYYTIQVNVNGCSANNVWPGDANYDGVADAYDVLAVGQAFSDSGYVRSSASLSWQPQPSSDWQNTFLNGVNHKHADTDGNGLVEFADTVAILLNYGLNHPLRNQPSNSLSVGNISVSSSADTVGVSMPVDFDFHIDTPLDSIYGLAFKVFFDPTLIKPLLTQVSYSGSWFGSPGTDMVKVDKVVSNTGWVDIGLSRIDHQNLSGTGQVVRVTIVTTDNVSGKVSLHVEPTGIVAVTAAGVDEVISPESKDLVIDPNYLGLSDMNSDNTIIVAPVPSRDYIILAAGQDIISVQLVDLSGREVNGYLADKDFRKINIGSLNNGVYELRIRTKNGIAVRQIVKI